MGALPKDRVGENMALVSMPRPVQATYLLLMDHLLARPSTLHVSYSGIFCRLFLQWEIRTLRWRRPRVSRMTR